MPTILLLVPPPGFSDLPTALNERDQKCICDMLLKFQILPSGTLHNGFKFFRIKHFLILCSCISMTNFFYFQVIVEIQDVENRNTLSETVSPHCIVGTQCTLSYCLEAKKYVWVGMEGI